MIHTFPSNRIRSRRRAEMAAAEKALSAMGGWAINMSLRLTETENRLAVMEQRLAETGARLEQLKTLIGAISRSVSSRRREPKVVRLVPPQRADTESIDR